MRVHVYLCIIFLLSYLLVEDTLDRTPLPQAAGDSSGAQQMASAIPHQELVGCNTFRPVHLGQSEHSKTKK